MQDRLGEGGARLLGRDRDTPERVGELGPVESLAADLRQCLLVNPVCHFFPPHGFSNMPPVQPFESSPRSTITARHSPRWHVDDFITPKSRQAPGRWFSDRATAFASAAFRIVVTAHGPP